MTISKNGVGILAFVLGLIGVNVAEADLVTTLSTLSQIVGGVLVFWNQVARPNVRKFIFKEEA